MLVTDFTLILRARANVCGVQTLLVFFPSIIALFHSAMTHQIHVISLSESQHYTNISEDFCSFT